MNMHVGSLRPPGPPGPRVPRRFTFTFCLGCGRTDRLRLTGDHDGDRSSLKCACGTIMPAEICE